MPTKSRLRHALKATLVFGIVSVFAMMIIRPEGQSLTFHYVLHQIWPGWVLVALPAYFLVIYCFDPELSAKQRKNAPADPKQSPDKP